MVTADHGEVLEEERCSYQHERSISDHVLRVPLVRWAPDIAPQIERGLVGLVDVPALLRGESISPRPACSRRAECVRQTVLPVARRRAGWSGCGGHHQLRKVGPSSGPWRTHAGPAGCAAPGGPHGSAAAEPTDRRSERPSRVAGVRRPLKRWKRLAWSEALEGEFASHRRLPVQHAQTAVTVLPLPGEVEVVVVERPAFGRVGLTSLLVRRPSA